MSAPEWQELRIRIRNDELLWSFLNLEGRVGRPVPGSQEESTLVGRPIRAPRSPGVFRLYVTENSVALSMNPRGVGDPPVTWQGRGTLPSAIRAGGSFLGNYTVNG
ncbi:hypothetical protein PLICRDRAFT_533981 [Plicaturopsis crispa FD-325 SS-3]|nr:hypothetical protein PLICRDRAFT_533981 [Plicaturopsis crispa FD-325 SS-3]